MDIIENCSKLIKEKLDGLSQQCSSDPSRSSNDENDVLLFDSQHQSSIDSKASIYCEKDRNIEKILHQQVNVKRIVDYDSKIRSLRRALIDDRQAIEKIRIDCKNLSNNVIKFRQDHVEVQARELERLQIQLLKMAATEDQRLKNIVEQRKKEIANLKEEIAKEEKNRDAHLAAYEKDLEKQIQQRQDMRNVMQ